MRESIQPQARILCPAKINLHLRVERKRPDGYHDIVTLMQSLELHDEILLKLDGEGIRLECEGFDLPAGTDNLLWQAVHLFQEMTGHRFGLKVLLRKRIPVGAGLGGGSSDAAGLLCELNKLTGQNVVQDRLSRWAARLGADIPFFLLGSPAIATGIGEKLKPVTIVPPLYYLLAFPGWSVSTRWAYENLDLELTSCPKEINIPTLIERVDEVIGLLHNDLESVTARVHPWISRTKARLLDLGAHAALMSGSGPTVFGLFTDEEACKRAWQRFRPEGTESIWWVRGC